MKYDNKIWILSLALIFIFLSCQSNQEKQIQKGKHYLSNHAYEDAAAEFLVALKDNPSHSEANYLLGLSYAKMGQFQRCDTYFTKAYFLSPDLRPLIISHYYELGERRKSIRDKDSAIKSFAKVLELDPSYDLGENFFYLGDYYFDNGQFNECINAYQKATLQFPDAPQAQEAHFRIAKCYSELKNYQAALAETDSFLDIYPDANRSTKTEINWIKGQSAYNLAEGELEEKNYGVVIEYCNILIKTQLPKVLVDDAYFLRGDAYLSMGKIADAKSSYHEVIKLNPTRSGRLVELTEQRLHQIYNGNYSIENTSVNVLPEESGE